VIRFTVYGVIAEKLRVSQLGRTNFSVHPVAKTLRWIKKWLPHFWWSRRALWSWKVRGRSYNARWLWCKNVCLFFVTLSRSSGIYFEQLLGRCLWVDFHPVSIFFFRSHCPFRTARTVLNFVARWRHNFREIAVKNCKMCKNWRKRLCAPLGIDSWEIWRKFHSSSLRSRM